MNRLTVDKKTEYMTMVELAHNSCFAKDHEAWYRDFEAEISARDLARNLMCEFGRWDHEDIEVHDDNVFDEVITDNLAEPMYTAVGLIAVFYRNMWAMANLRERLKEYEDAEEQGLLLHLPCEIGTRVWIVGKRFSHRETVHVGYDHMGEIVEKRDVYRSHVSEGKFKLENIKDVGKTIFLTREEAEAKMAEWEAEHG